MKAIAYDAYGPPGVLRVQEVPTPTPQDDEVLLRVHASSINDYDWHLLTGRPWINRVGGPVRPRYRVLGSDVAGTVEAVGPDVTRFRPGDEVFGDLSPCGFGAFAEYAKAPQGALARKPSALTFEQAAAVPQAGGLAVMAMRSGPPLRAGVTVLVNGAGGGVGTFAVQVAKAFGCEVTGVDVARKLDAILAAGADHVIDYEQQDFAELGPAFDLIVDVASHRSMHRYRRSLRPGGTGALIGGSIPRLLLAMAFGPVASLAGSRKVRVPLWKPNNDDDVAYLTGLLESGSVVPLVDSVFPLAEVPRAFEYYAKQQHRGKIVITV